MDRSSTVKSDWTAVEAGCSARAARIAASAPALGAARGRVGGVGGDSAGKVHDEGAGRHGRAEGCDAETMDGAGVGGGEGQSAVEERECLLERRQAGAHDDGGGNASHRSMRRSITQHCPKQR